MAGSSLALWIAIAAVWHLLSVHKVSGTSDTEAKCMHGTWKHGECVCKQGYKTDHQTEDVTGALHPVYCNTTAHILVQHYQWTGTDVLQLVATALTVVLATTSALGLFHFLIHILTLFFVNQKLKIVQEKENAFLTDIEKYKRDMDLVPTLWDPSDGCRLINPADGTQDVYAPAGASAPTPTTGNLRQTAETPDSGGNRDVLETDIRESPKAKPEELTTAHSAHDDAGIDQSTTTASGNLIDFGSLNDELPCAPSRSCGVMEGDPPNQADKECGNVSGSGNEKYSDILAFNNEEYDDVYHLEVPDSNNEQGNDDFGYNNSSKSSNEKHNDVPNSSIDKCSDISDSSHEEDNDKEVPNSSREVRQELLACEVEVDNTEEEHLDAEDVPQTRNPPLEEESKHKGKSKSGKDSTKRDKKKHKKARKVKESLEGEKPKNPEKKRQKRHKKEDDAEQKRRKKPNKCKEEIKTIVSPLLTPQDDSSS